MTSRESNAIGMAMAVESLAVVADDRMIYLGPLDRYANALGLGHDDARTALNDALELLESDGHVSKVRGSYFATDMFGK